MKLNFCPECAAPLRKQDATTYRCDQGHPYYNNPRAACSIILVNEQGELLYAKRARDPAKGKYDFPGGFLDYGEDAWQAARREAAEELGISIAPADLELIDSEANTYMEHVTTCDFIFLCRSWQGEPVAADDVAALEWHDVGFLRTDRFCWSYPYLFDTLQTKLASL